MTEPPSTGPPSTEPAGESRRFEGAQIPVSAHEGDDGSLDPAVAEALAGLSTTPDGHRLLQHALVGRRVLLPTTAVLEESDVDPTSGLEHEKSSHMAAAQFRSNAGWTGLLVFSSIASVQAWDPAARPVPVTADEAAAAALEDGCEVLVLDFAGPVRAALSGSLLRALSQSRPALPPAEDPVVVEAIGTAASLNPAVVGIEVRAVEDVPQLAGALDDDAAPPDAVVVLALHDEADPQQVASELAASLAVEPVLRDRLDGGLAFVLSD